MAQIECGRGHLYDPEKYPVCPYCNGNQKITVTAARRTAPIRAIDPMKTEDGSCIRDAGDWRKPYGALKPFGDRTPENGAIIEHVGDRAAKDHAAERLWVPGTTGRDSVSWSFRLKRRENHRTDAG